MSDPNANNCSGCQQNNTANDVATIVLGVTALFVSLIALTTSVAQVLQQYIASASDGYRRCTKQVMSGWANGTQRKFRTRELRFEVIFETPIIFLAEPGNTRGPLKTPIYPIDGTDESYKDTNTSKPLPPPPEPKTEKERAVAEEKERVALEKAEKSLRIHTVDDERATWVTLLIALHKEHKDGRDWEEQKKTGQGPPPVPALQYTVCPAPATQYTICHSLQKKRRSWDFMPSGTTKPYATTNVTHLIEMAALLGMHWKSMDVARGEMTAEGNGYLFSSSQVRGLGIMTSFSITGPSRFQQKRVVPSIAIKDLVFGFVPCILDRPLEVGNLARAKKTLATFSCDSNVISIYEKKKVRTYMFSVTFEMIAMLADVFRLKNSLFRYIPNPTSDTWQSDVSKVDWWTALETLAIQVEQLVEYNRKANHKETLIEEVNSSPAPIFEPHPLLIIILGAIKTITKLPDYKTGMKEYRNAQGHLEMLPLWYLEALHKGHDATSVWIRDKQNTISNVKLTSIMSSHIAAILAHSENLEAALTHPGRRSSSSGKVIEYYFSDILASVLTDGAKEESDNYTGTTATEKSIKEESGEDEREREKKWEENEQERWNKSDDKKEREAVWCALMFRMITWSLLHDFDEEDVNMVPSELKGSRMPIFIG